MTVSVKVRERLLDVAIRGGEPAVLALDAPGVAPAPFDDLVEPLRAPLEEVEPRERELLPPVPVMRSALGGFVDVLRGLEDWGQVLKWDISTILQ